MGRITPEQKIDYLCQIFNCEADVDYVRKRGTWYVSLRNVYECVETGSTSRGPDGKVEKLLAAGHSISGQGRSLSDAVVDLEKQTTKKSPGIVVSNQCFGLFSMNDDEGPHIISIFEGTKKVDSFPYEKERVRTAIHKYNPK